MRRRASRGEAQRFIRQAIAAEQDGCLPWPFLAESEGYPLVRWDGKTQRAHRAVLIAVAGPPLPGQEALHSCDVALCCNPRHLRWDTHAVNMVEAVERRRHGCARGERAGRSRLTAPQVLAIRASTAPARVLAADHGVSMNAIYDVKHRRSWSHL